MGVFFFQKKKLWLILLMTGMLFLPVLKKFTALHLIQTDSTSKSLSILSWNVRLFDLYNWSENTKTKQKMFEFLKQRESSFYCFQEYYRQFKPLKENNFATTSHLKQELHCSFVHEYFIKKNKHHAFGMATFSKYPIVNKGEVLFGDSSTNMCLFTDVLIKQDTIRIYNAHLASVRLENKEYNFLDRLTSDQADRPATNNELRLSVVNIYKRLLKAYTLRRKQVNMLSAHIEQSPHPSIFVGDFNDTPSSYTYNKISKKYADAFLKKGFGFGKTLNTLWSFFRIDYIFLDSDFFDIIDYKRYKVDYSDHFPITAKFSLESQVVDPI